MKKKLCSDCKHCKLKNEGLYSYWFCEILPKNKRGLRPEYETPNPKCPLNKQGNENSFVQKEINEDKIKVYK